MADQRGTPPGVPSGTIAPSGTPDPVTASSPSDPVDRVDGPPRRLAALDVARGVAILGTLATNIWIFSHPGGLVGYLQSPVTAAAPAAQQFLERVLIAFANGKFLGLLTLMFGIGLVIQAESARRRERPWPGSYPLRAALLFLEGLLNYLLIAEFDVLMGYAVTGAIVCFLVLRSPRTRRRWMIGCAAVHLALVTLVTAFFLTLPASGPTDGFGPGRRNPYAEGSFLDLVAFRLDNGALFRFEPVFIGAYSIAMFLLGATLYRCGIFDERGRVLRRRLLVAAAFALPLDIGLQLLHPGWMFASRYLLAPVVAAGLLALVTILVRDGRGWVARRFAEVGRTALSCYLGQNLICSVLFYGWGLGLGAEAGAARTWLTLGAFWLVCVLMAVFAHLWLRRFQRGPAEWAWHAAYARLVRGARK